MATRDSRGLAYRLFRSISAFLQTKLEYRRPTPLILVKAYMTFCLPSTLVLRRRKMNWKFDLSPLTSDMMGKLLCGSCLDVVDVVGRRKFEVKISRVKFWCGGFYRLA